MDMPREGRLAASSAAGVTIFRWSPFTLRASVAWSSAEAIGATPRADMSTRMSVDEMQAVGRMTENPCEVIYKIPRFYGSRPRTRQAASFDLPQQFTFLRPAV